jgi:DNA-binding LacI/PurR family transcriptional regulator
MCSVKRRITIIDVALEAGVSHATVSYVLNNDPRQSISEDTRARVMEAARKLDYQPYAPARLLRTGQSKIVLVVWPAAVIETGIAQVLEELAGAVSKLGFSLVWQVGFSPEQEQLAANLAPAVVVWLGDKSNPAAIASLQRFKAPIITITGISWFKSGPRLQVEYLLKQGPRPIIFAATEKPQLQSMCQSRLGIVRQTCAEFGLPEPRVVTISLEREKARKAMKDLLAVLSPPFAICAFNDDVAFAVLAALYDLQIAVPQAVSVISHDNTRIAELCNPPLTSIGNETSELLDQLIASVTSVCQGGPVLEIITPEAKVNVRASA